MTPEELEETVLAGDRARVLELVRGATEDERRAAGARALALQKRLGSFKAHLAEATKLDGDRGRTSTLALLGTGSPSQIRDGAWVHAVEGDFDVLSCRPPELLLELAPWLVDKLGWQRVRNLVRAGKMPRPDCDEYIVGMLGHEHRQPPVLDDPDLLDYEVWRLFEVEGTQQSSLADYDRFHGDRWQRFFLELAAYDAASRERLLDASLSALERDFIAFRAGWFSRFHEALKPTPEERTGRTDTYLRLLRSPIPATVSMAVGALEAIQKAGQLDGQRLLDAVAPALQARVAGTSARALRLVERAVKGEPAIRSRAWPVVAAALSHSSVNVQAAALCLLERWLDGEVEPVAILSGYRDDVAPSLRPRYEALMTRLGVGPPEVQPGPHIASSTSLAEATPADPFAGLVRVEPVETLPELVELVSAVLENCGPPDDIERVLDGISRLAGDRPADFDRLVRPVRSRADQIRARHRHCAAPLAPCSDGSIPRILAGVVTCWVDRVTPNLETWPKPTLGRFLVGRAREVALAAATGVGRPMLAAPTHIGGWIEPAALVERLGVLLASGTSGDDFLLDLTQALLRLLPFGREDGLAATRGLPDVESTLAVRHALGDDVPVGRSPALWIAAARCRNPDGDDAAVARVHGAFGAGGAVAGTFRMSFTDKIYLSHAPTVDASPPVSELATEVPSAVLPAAGSLSYGTPNFEDGGFLGWLRLVWPQSRRSWFAAAARRLGHNLDWWEAQWENRELLEPLFEDWTTIGSEAWLLLAVALQCKEPGEQGLAVEAVAHLLTNRKLSDEQLVSAMAALELASAEQGGETYPDSLLRPQRFGAAMLNLAGYSPAHAAAALRILAGALGPLASRRIRSPAPVGQFAAPLRVLVELSAQTGASVPITAEPILAEFARGKGEAARLATRLLGK